MYKKLFSTNRIGFVLNTNEWLLGIDFYLSKNKDSLLLSIGFLCFHLHIVIERGKKR